MCIKTELSFVFMKQLMQRDKDRRGRDKSRRALFTGANTQSHKSRIKGAKAP